MRHIKDSPNEYTDTITLKVTDDFKKNARLLAGRNIIE